MKHLEPLPQEGLSQPAPQGQPRRSNRKIAFAVAALVLILGGGAALSALFDPSSSDSISASTRSQLTEQFAATKAVKLTPVPMNQIDTALATMKLTTVQRDALKRDLLSSPGSSGTQSTLAWIELWDFATQDGDVVHISSAGYELDYPIVKQAVRFAVPVDASSSITIRGVYDGGGGITLGLRSGVVALSLPVIEPGQSLQVPVTF
ncbi:hypothetical protein [Pseudomonas sp. SCB32]|uniref:hypothetical protein n=1 Tax=Pseudomonas sp. SCB32 TaxID=2653853 RepID=UPI0012651946|nr:hypothetical protein [Pseudomonas sp. SCB32]